MPKKDFDDLPPEITTAPGDAPDDTPIDDGLSEDERQRQEWLNMPAPYGRFKNGKPRKNPPGRKKATGRKATPKKTAGYEEGLNGIFQMAGFTLAMAGQKNKAFLADSVAIAHHGPEVSSALNALAMERPEVAAVLDRILAVGPYGLVLAAVLPLAMQLGANHGLPIPGAMSADELLAEAERAAKEAALAS